MEPLLIAISCQRPRSYVTQNHRAKLAFRMKARSWVWNRNRYSANLLSSYWPGNNHRVSYQTVPHRVKGQHWYTDRKRSKRQHSTSWLTSKNKWKPTHHSINYNSRWQYEIHTNKSSSNLLCLRNVLTIFIAFPFRQKKGKWRKKRVA